MRGALQEVAIFGQTEEIMMLKILIFPPNLSKMREEGLLVPDFAFLDDSFRASRRLSDNFQMAQNLGG